MKKLIFLLCLPMIIWSCGTVNYAQYDISNLRTGMSKAQVRSVIGSPERYLVSTMTPYGYQEVLQYRTSYSDLYALEFLNDYLIYAEYMYDGHYAPYYHQITVRPPYGNSIFPPNYRPGPPPSRPPGDNNRPDNNRPENIVNPLPPARDREPANNNNNNVRPPANNNSRPSNSRPSINDNNNSNTSRPPATTRPSVNENRRSSSDSENNVRSREIDR